MSGVRQDGILLTDDVGGGGGGSTNVDIVSPLGQQIMAGSIPVVIASNQSNVPVSITLPATDLTAFVAGTTKLAPVAGVFNDGLANVTSGNLAAPRITTQRGLHSNLRDSSGNEINSGILNSASIANTERAINTKAVLYLRNQDSTITAWTGDTGFTGFASNAYPFVKVFRTSINYADTTIGALNAQLDIQLQQRSLEAVWVLLRNSSLLGTISFFSGSTTATVLEVYDTRQQKWINGAIVNPGADTLYVVPAGGLLNVFVRCTAYTSGSLLASASGGPGTSAAYANISGSRISTKIALIGNAPAAVAVGVASALAIAANVNRRGLTLRNTSVNNISLGFGANPAVLNSGITLIPNAEWVMNEYSYSQEAINAIAAGAASNLAVQEFQ